MTAFPGQKDDPHTDPVLNFRPPSSLTPRLFVVCSPPRTFLFISLSGKVSDQILPHLEAKERVEPSSFDENL